VVRTDPPVRGVGAGFRPAACALGRTKHLGSTRMTVSGVGPKGPNRRQAVVADVHSESSFDMAGSRRARHRPRLSTDSTLKRPLKRGLNAATHKRDLAGDLRQSSPQKILGAQHSPRQTQGPRGAVSGAPLNAGVNSAAILDATPLSRLTRARFDEVQRIIQDGALWVTLSALRSTTSTRCWPTTSWRRARTISQI
jgi:hypothetical protein